MRIQRRPPAGVPVAGPPSDLAKDTCVLAYGGSPETDRANLLRAAEALADLVLADLERFPPDRGETPK